SPARPKASARSWRATASTATSRASARSSCTSAPANSRITLPTETPMHTTPRLLLCAATAFAATLAQAAEPFPSKPVTLLTAFAPGSGPDAVLRIVAEKLGKTWNQRVLVENKPGGAGFIAIDAAKRAVPDGYTLLQLDSEHLAALPYLYKARGFETLKTFEPVAALFRTPFLVAVASDS